MAKAEYRSAVRSRKLIKAALGDLLQEKPLDKITVTEVVNRAQINRGTFYAHYSDIPDVIHQMVEEGFRQIREVFSGQSLTLEQLPGELMKQLRSMLEEDEPFFRKVMASHSANQITDQLSGVVVEYLLNHEGDYFTDSHEEYEIKVRFCAGGLSRLYQDWLTGKLKTDQDTFYQMAQRMIHCIIGA